MTSSALHSVSDLPSPLEPLSARELEVLRLLALGRSNRAIGHTLRLGDRTVESHVRSIYAKLALEGDGATHRRVVATIVYWRAAPYHAQITRRPRPVTAAGSA